MADLKGSKTLENLKAAFAGESQANRRYLYFAKAADIEGYPAIANNFRTSSGFVTLGGTPVISNLYLCSTRHSSGRRSDSSLMTSFCAATRSGRLLA